MSMAKKLGFTLFELMVVMAILAIIVTIAYPSYADSIRKARRADAQAQMRQFEVAAARQYNLTRNYAGCSSGCDQPPGDDYYTYAVDVDPATQWSITATPKGGQAKDACGTMSLNSAGIMKGKIDGCWGGRGSS